jgi:hypothetical protein
MGRALVNKYKIKDDYTITEAIFYDGTDESKQLCFKFCPDLIDSKEYNQLLLCDKEIKDYLLTNKIDKHSNAKRITILSKGYYLVRFFNKRHNFESFSVVDEKYFEEQYEITK